MFLPIAIGSIVGVAVLLVIASVYMHEGRIGLRRRLLPIVVLSGGLVAIGFALPAVLQNSSLLWPVAALTSLASAVVAATQGWRASSQSAEGSARWLWWGLAAFFLALASGALVAAVA